MTPQHREKKHYQAENLFLRPLRYAQVMTQDRWILVQAAQRLEARYTKANIWTSPLSHLPASPELALFTRKL
jgi:hypothetical protein